MSLQPEKVVQYVREEFWACAYPRHRHPTYDEAKHCLEAKRPKSHETRQRQKKELIARARSVVEGSTYRQAGKKHGISPSRAQSSYYRVMRTGDDIARNEGSIVRIAGVPIRVVRTTLKKRALEWIAKVEKHWGVG